MKVLITGGNGQLGWELQRLSPVGNEICALSSSELDITDSKMINDKVKSFLPEVIINAAAYTAVDRAEQEVEKANLVNCYGVANLAMVAREIGARIVHISTDFVFDGEKSTPYLPEDRPNPTGVYGQSKLEGENKLFEITIGDNVAIVRTAWVYSCHGNNFVKTMLRLMAERDQLGVVVDQIGTPTWAQGLAQTIWQVASQQLHGTYHWTDAGVASWYDFAVAIQQEAHKLGILKRVIPIIPLQTKEYPTLAQRPQYSVLDRTSLCDKINSTPAHWQESLQKMLQELIDE